jgi:hypothetical protein
MHSRGSAARSKQFLNIRGGDSEEDLLAEFPNLEPEDIRALSEDAEHEGRPFGVRMKFVVDAQLPRGSARF